jgi:hypothetical protein
VYKYSALSSLLCIHFGTIWLRLDVKFAVRRVTSIVLSPLSVMTAVHRLFRQNISLLATRAAQQRPISFYHRRETISSYVMIYAMLDVVIFTINVDPIGRGFMRSPCAIKCSW